MGTILAKSNIKLFLVLRVLLYKIYTQRYLLYFRGVGKGRHGAVVQSSSQVGTCLAGSLWEHYCSLSGQLFSKCGLLLALLASQLRMTDFSLPSTKPGCFGFLLLCSSRQISSAFHEITHFCDLRSNPMNRFSYCPHFPGEDVSTASSLWFMSSSELMGCVTSPRAAYSWQRSYLHRCLEPFSFFFLNILQPSS